MSIYQSKTQFRFVTTIAFIAMFHPLLGCAEGPLWRSGKYAPWVRNQWAAEEQIADTLFAKKRRMEELVARSINGPIDQQEQAARELAATALEDRVLLTRLHAVRMLGRLDNSPTAVEALQTASKDSERDIRLAAVRSWESQSADIAVPQLQEIIGSDTDIDVRLAATRALGNFPGRASVEALSLSLNDQDPALQVRAAESLGRVTGESFGRNVVAWQQYVNGTTGNSIDGLPAADDANERVAEQPQGSGFR